MATGLPRFVEKMSEYDPDFYALLKDTLYKAIQTEALDEKTRYLILLALDISKGASEGVKVLVSQAREAGAEEEEIREVARLAYFVTGMDAIKTSLNLFEKQ